MILKNTRCKRFNKWINSIQLKNKEENVLTVNNSITNSQYINLITKFNAIKGNKSVFEELS